MRLIMTSIKRGGLVFLLVATACAPSASRRGVGEILDDNTISVKLKTLYMKDKVVDNSDIKIKVRKGVVQLSGVVDNQEEINRAIEIAEKQRGVKEVKAYLVLKDVGELRDEPRPSKKRAQKKSKKTVDTGLNETDLSDPSQNPTLESVNQQPIAGGNPQPVNISDTTFEE